MSITDFPQDSQLTRNIGPRVRICQINIEGISYAKCQHLRRILIENHVDVVAVQETHAENESQLMSRGKIPGYDLIGATYHKSYGTATYARNDIENVSLGTTSTNNGIHEVTMKIGEITVKNIYKPPATEWPHHVTQPLPHPGIYVGDFNSHHQLWKYRRTDANGEKLMNWAEENNLHLVFDAKDRGSFRSAAWEREYNPDLSFVTSNESDSPLPTSRRVLDDFPHSQHRPILVEIGISIPLIKSTPRPRWNFGKADWPTFADNLDKCLGWIPPTKDNYERFSGAVTSTAKKCMPRGYQKEYIPGWNKTSEALYIEFLE